MENAFPSVIETDGYAPQKNPRRHARRPICLRVAVADKSGMAEGQSLNLSLRGGGLRVGKRLVRGQYLWLKIYHAQGRSTAICDLVRVNGSNRARWGSSSCISHQRICNDFTSFWAITVHSH